MPLPDKDKAILRELGRQVADIGNLPVQKAKADLWRQLNGLKRTRPLVWINEVCWWEMNVGDELTARCTDKFCQGIENPLRMLLYQWRHFPADMVVDPFLTCGRAIRDTGYGMETHATRLAAQGMTAADFVPIITTEADVDKIQTPRITVDREASDRNLAAMREIFDGVIEVRRQGISTMWFAAWDQLIQWYGITELYTDMMDRPQLVHKAIARMVEAMLARLDQYESLGVLAVTNNNHRVGSGGLGITDELPAADYDGADARPIDQWGTATGQIFSEVSPDMHEEFCLQYERKWLSRFGLNCYGCCEPLHNKIHLMRTIPRIRRISMSPWVNLPTASERMGKDFVFSAKPNPAVLAVDHWNVQAARADLKKILDATRGNIVELILKDISTVRDQPQRLWDWAAMAMEVVQDYA